MSVEKKVDSLDEIWKQLVEDGDTDRIADDSSQVENLLCELNEVRLLLNEDSAIDDATQLKQLASVGVELGTEIDGHMLTRKLGRGGMGVVYAAYQDRLAREVALKLIRLGPLADLGEVTRTEFEALTAARLNHPGIVRVYDSGHWEGYHYYTMELVDGPTLSQLLSDGPISPRQAVAYVKEICDAVSYAHAEGVLHRDLKPSNVMIADDGKIRIADFGLAKLLEDDGRESDLTRSGAMMGTPSYMSPEQASGDSKRVTTASDVYSIGAILYELLVGRAPFRAATPMETMRQVIDQEPVSPRSLNSDLSADLETICLKCLQKSPNDRYATPLALADDLQAVLDHRPISARPISWFEKVQRWRRRSPALALTVFLLAFSLLAGTVTSLAMWRRSALHAKTAERQARNAEAVASFFTEEIFQQANPSAAVDRDIRLSEAVDSAAQLIEDRFADQPFIRGTIRATIGNIYKNLGKFEESREHLELAVEAAKELYGENSETAIRTEYALNMLNYLEGRHEPALKEYRRLVNVATEHLGKSHDLTLNLEGQLGHLLYWNGDYDEARPIYESVLAKQLATGQGESDSSFITRNNLGLLHSSSGNFERAEELYIENLALQREFLGDEHADTLTTLNNLGYLYCARDELDLAKECYDEALRSRRKVFGDEHPFTCFSIHNMGLLLAKKGDLGLASQYMDEAYAARSKVLGDDNMHTQNSLLALCNLKIRLEEWETAATLCRKALDITQEHCPNRWRNYLAMSHLGAALAGLGKHEEAQPYLIEGFDSLANSDETIPEPDRSDQIRDAGERLVAMLKAAGKQSLADEWQTKREAIE